VAQILTLRIAVAFRMFNHIFFLYISYVEGMMAPRRWVTV